LRGSLTFTHQLSLEQSGYNVLCGYSNCSYL